MSVARIWLTEFELLDLGYIQPLHRVFYGTQLGKDVILHVYSQPRIYLEKSQIQLTLETLNAARADDP